MNDLPDNRIVNEAVELAKAWQDRANELMTQQEKSIQDQMAKLLTHRSDKVVFAKLIDQCFRSKEPDRVADQVNLLFREFGIPVFFSTWEKDLVRLFMGVGRHVPKVSVPMMIEKIRKMSGRWVKFGEKDFLRAFLEKRKEQGVRININRIGEAVLGEKEALFRLDTYIDDLKQPDIESISVKISTIYSQIQPIAFDHTVDILTERLSRLYSTAKSNSFIRKDKTRAAKLVNLDMEKYLDLETTLAAFTRTLDKDEFKDYTAGIVLQAYIPASFEIQKRLTAWAQERVANGGNPINLRIVKGANMEMEMLEASLNNWPLAPYDNKLDVDANFKLMVTFGMEKKNIEAVNLGIASHNLFDLAYAYTLARQNDVTGCFSFEMLEGMADHLQRAVSETAQDILLYTPVADKERFINAVAYLMRRLDENTAKENFLRYSFGLTTDSDNWNFLKNQFIESFGHMERVDRTLHRVQNRKEEDCSIKEGTYYENEFINEPNTDFSLAVNREWAGSIREKWKKSPGDEPDKIPLVVAGKEIYEGRETMESFDHSQVIDGNSADDKDSKKMVCIASCAIADDNDIDEAAETAKADPDGWRNKSLRERHKILSRVAASLRSSRGDLIGSAAACTGKIFTESDAEVSEAIDFTEFYPYSAYGFDGLKGTKCSGKGVGLVISPWNFPIAIPCGGIAASLAAGNTVILKPASFAVPAAWQLCMAFWKAGVSKNVLQFLPCDGETKGAKLASHKDIDFVIFTGSTDTALKIMERRPNLFLAAETGGKNATIVTSMSDRDQAVKNILHSAYSNSGQKCSATSLLILEKEVYEDESFKKHLIDAAESYPVGSPWNFENKMGTLIQPPKGVLRKAVEELEPGELWALKPRYVQDNNYMLTPGIKWGVQPGSFTHMTEFFGPLIGVMSAKDIDHAVELVNETGYGLTSGLESLDKREQKRFTEGIKAGNLYINRGTTGAIVLRQPFGGMGKSAIGGGIKAGGLNYVSQFMNFEEISYPVAGAIQEESSMMQLIRDWRLKLIGKKFAGFETDIKMTIRAVMSYLFWAEQEFLVKKDYFHIPGQDNIVLYLPAGRIVVRIHKDDTLFDILARAAAAKISGCKLTISTPVDLENEKVDFLLGREPERLVANSEIVRQSDEELIKMMPEIQRIRYGAPDRVPVEVFKEAARAGFYISRTKVMMEGRIELLQYIQEQSICINYHRYGNLGERAFD